MQGLYTNLLIYYTNTLGDRLYLPFIYRQETEALENLSNLPKFPNKMQWPNSGTKLPEFKPWLCHY